MKIAVIQHALRESPDEDARAVAAAAVLAAARGAELVILPEVQTLHPGGGLARELYAELLGEVPAFCLIPNLDPSGRSTAFVTDLSFAEGLPEGLGVAALLAGDACMDPAEFSRIAGERPSLAVLVPRSESDLQAEAMLELAIALSDSLAGLVIIAECSGAALGEPGHGGSAVVQLGEVAAEAIGGDDVLFAEVKLPVPQPEPREALPAIPPLLAQRLAVHQGRGAVPPSYPAELS